MRRPDRADGIGSPSDRGIVLPAMAIVLTALLTMAALVVDIGLAKWQRREAQNAVDAAALSGSWQIRELQLNASSPGRPSQRNGARVCLKGDQEVGSAPCRNGGGDPREVAVDTVDRNRFDPETTVVNWPPVDGEHADDVRCIQIKVTGSAETVFAGVIGRNAVGLSAEAVGCTGDLNPDNVGPVPALLALGECGFETLDISGSNSEFIGGVVTNAGGKIGGSSNTFYDSTVSPGSAGSENDPANRVRSADWTGTDSGSADFKTFDNNYPAGSPGTLDTPLEDPLGSFIRMQDFTPAADGGNGNWEDDPNFYDLDRLFPGADTIDSGTLKDGGLYDDATGELRAGVYYSTRKIDFGAELNGVTPGTVLPDGTAAPVGITIVHRDVDTGSEQGILFSGSNGTSGQVVVEPYVPNLLVFTDESVGACASSNVVSVSGQNHRFAGIVYAPRGRAEFSGSDTHLEPGAVVAQQIKINGSDLTVNALDLEANTVPWNRVISRLVS